MLTSLHELTKQNPLQMGHSFWEIAKRSAQAYCFKKFFSISSTFCWGEGEPPTKFSKWDGELDSISVFRVGCYLTTTKIYKQKCVIKTGKF